MKQIKLKLDEVLILEDDTEVRYANWPSTSTGIVDKTKCYWDEDSQTIIAKTVEELFNELKEELKAQIHEDCEAEMKTTNQGFYSENIEATIDCREIDVLRIDQLIDLMEHNGAIDQTSVGYICYDNSVKQVTLSDVKLCRYELINKLMEMLYYKHDLYDQIDSTEYVEENEIPTSTGLVNPLSIRNIIWQWSNE